VRDHQNCTLSGQYTRWRFDKYFLIPADEFDELYNHALKVGLLGKAKPKKNEKSKQTSDPEPSHHGIDTSEGTSELSVAVPYGMSASATSGAYLRSPTSASGASLLEPISTTSGIPLPDSTPAKPESRPDSPISQPDEPPGTPLLTTSEELDEIQQDLAGESIFQQRIAIMEARNAEQAQRLKNMQGRSLRFVFISHSLHTLEIIGEIRGYVDMRRDIGTQVAALHLHITHIGEALNPLRERLSTSHNTPQITEAANSAHKSWEMAYQTIHDVSHQYPPLPSRPLQLRAPRDSVVGSTWIKNNDSEGSGSRSSRKRTRGM
jgi:hypothetical protein